MVKLNHTIRGVCNTMVVSILVVGTFEAFNLKHWISGGSRIRQTGTGAPTAKLGMPT